MEPSTTKKYNKKVTSRQSSLYFAIQSNVSDITRELMQMLKSSCYETKSTSEDSSPLLDFPSLNIQKPNEKPSQNTTKEVQPRSHGKNINTSSLNKGKQMQSRNKEITTKIAYANQNNLQASEYHQPSTTKNTLENSQELLKSSTITKQRWNFSSMSPNKTLQSTFISTPSSRNISSMPLGTSSTPHFEPYHQNPTDVPTLQSRHNPLDNVKEKNTHTNKYTLQKHTFAYPIWMRSPHPDIVPFPNDQVAQLQKFKTLDSLPQDRISIKVVA